MSGSEVGIKPLLLPPQLRTLEAADGRRASYLELFFDLVFVVAIIAALVLVGLALVGGVLAPVVFMAIAATTLVLLVVFKLWTAQRLLRMSTG